ncbi:MAG: DUF1127 domain-containing protein [Rhodobacteraceae bacterium]|jgi:uncharacterized protein YjiS (DUF1127 family)|nr:DUF1127 domain-containing protein [Paracoccaceae bacterium]
MATLDHTRNAASDRVFGANLSSAVSAVIGRVVAWNDARVTRKALSRLSDHELADIGLSRSDIDSIR